MIETLKRENGQFFTIGNCFKLNPFKEWFESIPDYKKITLIEPFAGEGNIPNMMKEIGYENRWEMYDLYPKNDRVKLHDSILLCPRGKCIITNPPYLAKNSATRRGLNYPKCEYDDLYKLSLDKMLESSEYVAAIIPESFITSGLFLRRINTIISLKSQMFNDTECPVCLALFSPNLKRGCKNNIKIYTDNNLIGNIDELKLYLPILGKNNINWKFNLVEGNIGLIAYDDCKSDTIKFIDANMIPSEEIKGSSRLKTRILGNFKYDEKLLIKEANNILKDLRNNTQDVFLTPFKGIREDGKYRRRLDYGIAKSILSSAAENLKYFSKYKINKSI